MLRLDPVEKPSTELVEAIIKRYNTTRYELLQAYYEGHHKILTREMKDKMKPNNKLVNNFPGYIVDVSTGYFLGKPVSYTCDDEMAIQEIQEIFDFNEEEEENESLAKTAAIKGHSFELLYADDSEAVLPRFNVIPPENGFVFYDKTVAANPSLGVRIYSDTDILMDSPVLNIEIYTKNKVFSYVANKNKKVSPVEETEHYFDGIPIIEYLNNNERQGDFEKVLYLIDAYDIAQSDTINDAEYFADAYLKLKNMSGTTHEQIKKMKEQRVLLLDNDGDAEWMIKDMQNTSNETTKQRLQADIHRFSKTPNLTDESFAQNLSGVAIEYKLWGLEQTTAQKESNFKKALQRRLQLICNFLSRKGKNYDWRDFNISFTRNMPQNVKEIVDTANNLRGLMSLISILSYLPMVSDPEAEKKRLLEDEDWLGANERPRNLL